MTWPYWYSQCRPPLEPPLGEAPARRSRSSRCLPHWSAGRGRSSRLRRRNRFAQCRCGGLALLPSVRRYGGQLRLAGRPGAGGARAVAIAAAGVAVWLVAEVVYRVVESHPSAAYPPLTRALLVTAFALATTTLVLWPAVACRASTPVASRRVDRRPGDRGSCGHPAVSRVRSVGGLPAGAAGGVSPRRPGDSRVRGGGYRADGMAPGLVLGPDRGRDCDQRRGQRRSGGGDHRRHLRTRRARRPPVRGQCAQPGRRGLLPASCPQP